MGPVTLSNCYTAMMLTGVTAGGYTLAGMGRICHTHCSKAFKASEMDFISMLPLGMALGR